MKNYLLLSFAFFAFTSFYSCNYETILEQPYAKESFTKGNQLLYDITEYNNAIGLITNIEKLLSGNTKSASTNLITPYYLSFLYISPNFMAEHIHIYDFYDFLFLIDLKN